MGRSTACCWPISRRRSVGGFAASQASPRRYDEQPAFSFLAWARSLPLIANSSMSLLGIDIGSSSVKCAILRNGRVHGQIVHAKFPTRRDGVKVEVDPPALLKAITSAAKQVEKGGTGVDAVALSVMSPAWVAMDKNGHP